MGNVLLDEIEKRQRNIDEYNVKSERVAELRVELANLENDIANTNIEILQSEIDYLTGVAIREGVIKQEDCACAVDEETAPTVETVAE